MTWEQVPFLDVVQSRGSGGAGLPQSEWLERGRFPVIGQGSEFIEGWTDREDLVLTPKPGLVLYGGHTRRAKYVDRPFVPGPNVKILEPRTKLEPKFLFHYLAQLKIESRGYADHFPEVRRCVVPLPPLAEQRRIAAILDKADALRSKRREAIAKLDQLLESVFLDMFGDPVSNQKGWPARTLEDATKDLKRGPFGGALKKEIFVPTGYAVYEQQHAIYGDFAEVRYFIDSAKFSEMKAFSVVPGNLIVSCSGTMGRVAVVPDNAKAGVINQALLRITPKDDVLRGSFLADVLRSESMQTHLFGISRGSGLKNFPPMSDVRGLQVICPPVSLQERYLDTKSSIRALRALHTEGGGDRLFDALQRSAFSGGI